MSRTLFVHCTLVQFWLWFGLSGEQMLNAIKETDLCESDSGICGLAIDSEVTTLWTPSDKVDAWITVNYKY